jgi:Arc/MetJ family transcription regulator
VIDDDLMAAAMRAGDLDRNAPARAMTIRARLGTPRGLKVGRH